MGNPLTIGAFLAILSGLMNGSFTLPMRFLGRWQWENVWSVFILVSCLVLPAGILSLSHAHLFAVIALAPARAVVIAVLTGFAWGFGAIMFGQSVSAIGISLANTLVLAISSVFGALLPLLLLAPQKISQPSGHKILTGVAVEILGIVLCGYAGRLREAAPQSRGDFVGHARPFATGLLLAAGAGLLSGVFNVGFALAHPIATAGRRAGLSAFTSTNVIWWLMLGSGSVANLAFCAYLFRKNRSFATFRTVRAPRYYLLSILMALLWGGSIFVYGAAASSMGALGAEIGWPLSLATGLLFANAIGIALGEWKGTPAKSRAWMYAGLAILVVAIVQLSRANG